ncbi:pentatricopeptide repeat-containing protein At3g29230 [Ricinus communis]|uniref:pentatricopeptide repeat-containing protein At3g29230 n=1 Tax=Ricinus communis TaxID=3988 RepID=UPI000772B54A|nr:pentatricopeptide repeat-containing protein At3g29230 [Ricinus communis]|eukprot:XP_015581233.1 pentatricopeptide repeat-containing protein At3g29230 [Ricinus communis]
MPCNFQEKISHILPKCTFQHLKQIHAFIIAASLTHNIQIFSKFLRRSTEFGSMDYSHLIFSQMGHDYFITEIMLWNIMIRGYAFNGPFERAISMFDEIPQRGLKPHNYTYPYVLNSCCEMGIYEKGKRVHCQIIKSGFESNFAVGHSLFNMYIKMPAFTDTVFADNYEMIDARKIFDNMCVRPVEVWNKMVSQYVSFGNVRSARELFEAMPERDVVSWNSMISGYVKVGEVKNARELFEWMPEKNVISWTLMIVLYGDTGDFETARRFLEKMPHRNVVSWNSMISSYTKFGKFIEALDLFVQMQSEGVIPDGYTFVSVLSACSNLGNLEYGKYIHYLIGKFSQLEVMVGTALIEMYAHCGDVNRSFAVFIKIPNKDVFCWNVMIKSLAINGRTEDAIKIFYLMQKLGLKLNDFTFTSALFACSHGGLLEEGRRIFYSMDKDYKISSKLEHFGCLIDLLSRNGKVEEALLLVNKMPMKPDIAIWGALLGGCSIRNDSNLAEKAIKRVGDLETAESGVYVLLSNIYASMGRWTEALGARGKMEKKKIRKEAGSSIVF